LRWRAACKSGTTSMRALPLLTGLTSLAALAGSAAGEPARCTIIKIKTKAVSIDVPVNARIAPELSCKTGAQRAAKQYALDNHVCELNDAREATFSVTATWRSDGKLQTFDLNAYCPVLTRRK
jgi:hypothetical protein